MPLWMMQLVGRASCVGRDADDNSMMCIGTTWRYLGAYGNADVSSPRWTSLAAAGIRLPAPTRPRHCASLAWVLSPAVPQSNGLIGMAHQAGVPRVSAPSLIC